MKISFSLMLIYSIKNLSVSKITYFISIIINFLNFSIEWWSWCVKIDRFMLIFCDTLYIKNNTHSKSVSKDDINL